MVAKWRLRLVWAILAAVVTSLGLHTYLASLGDTDSVVVAATEIPVRAAITADMLKTAKITKADRATLAADSFQSADLVVGRYARRTIAAGEVLRDRPADMSAPGEVQPAFRPGEGALADFLQGDARAMTVSMDQQGVVGQHVKVGDAVDLIFTSKSDATGGIYASVVLQHIFVLDIQRPSEDQPDGNVLVTFLVSADQAVDLALAKRTGVVDMALSAPDAGSPGTPRTVSPLQFIHAATMPAGTARSDPSPTPKPETSRTGGS